MELKGAVAIVTGSSSGIGKATGLAFAAKGCRVVVNYTRNEEGARDVAKEIEALGSEAVIVGGDVAQDATCRALAQAALDKWGRIDVLVNNAGTTKFVAQDDLDGLSADDFLRIYGVNVVGAYQMIRACEPAMCRQGAGSVVNISSIAALTGQSSSTAYAASKGALLSLTKALARVLGPELRINAICPGFVDNRWAQLGMEADVYAKARQAQFEQTTLKGATTSEEIAEMISWLYEKARMMTGEVLRMDAGSHLGPTGRTFGSTE